jgi:hypothetical protein
MAEDQNTASVAEIVPANPSAGYPTEEKRRITPKQASSPVKVYTTNIGRKRAPGLRWELPEWDLAECGRIIDTESIVRRACAVKEALFLKEGYEFTGENPERVAYIKRRLAQMENAGGVPFRILLTWTVGSLVRTSNGFWAKRRDAKASGGGTRTTPEEKTLKPVAAYFNLPAETVRFKRDEFGRVKQYRQYIYGKKPVNFAPEDIIHFYYNKREGFSVGTPDLVPVKDDIRALRRIEENVELLYYAHLFPLYHYRVGTLEAPAHTYADGTTEVEVVQREVADMPADGCWVTPERHEIDVVGSEGEALDVKEVLSHFKKRIYVGLGVSEVDMGEGGTASRSTAQTLSRNLIDRTKADQRLLEAFIDKFVIEELLLESTFPKDTLFDEENQVHLKFREIDNEARQALENHISQMYMQNMLTHDESRDVIGKEPFTEADWENSYWHQIDEPTKLMQSLDEPYSPEAKAVARANTTSIEEPDLQEATAQKEKERKEELAVKRQTKKPQALPTRGGSVKKNKSSANRNRPRNQHGTRRSAKLNKDFYDAYEQNPKIPSLDPVFAQKPPIQNIFDSVAKDVVTSIRTYGYTERSIRLMVGAAFNLGKKRLVEHTKRAYRIGVGDTGTQYWQIDLRPRDVQITRHVDRFTDKLRDDVLDHIERNVIGVSELSAEDATAAEMTLEALAHRAKMIDENEVMRAYNAGKIDGYDAQDVENIELSRRGTQPCEICDHSTWRKQNGDAIIYEEIPPLHPGCMCEPTVASGN